MIFAISVQKVFNIEFKVVGGKIPSSDPITLVDGTQSRKVCYKGLPGDVEKQATNIEFVEEFTDRRSYTKAEGFLFNTAMTEFKGKVFLISLSFHDSLVASGYWAT